MPGLADIGAAQQPVDADLGRNLGPNASPPRARSRRLPYSSWRPLALMALLRALSVGLSTPTSLKPIWRQPHRPDLGHDVERVEDRLVLARQHENEVHRSGPCAAAFLYHNCGADRKKFGKSNIGFAPAPPSGRFCIGGLRQQCYVSHSFCASCHLTAMTKTRPGARRLGAAPPSV